MIFIAGQTSLDQDGELIGKNDFAAQAEQVFRNLNVALRSVGCTAGDLVKLTVFLRDMSNLSVYREARNRLLRDRHAARGSGGDLGGGVETLRRGLFDRDRGDRGRVTRLAQRKPACFTSGRVSALNCWMPSM